MGRSFITIRILHYTNNGPIRAGDVEQQLRRRGCAISNTRLRAVLGRMRRLGWIKPGRSGQEWLLTAKGRQVLESVKDSLAHARFAWLARPGHIIRS